MLLIGSGDSGVMCNSDVVCTYVLMLMYIVRHIGILMLMLTVMYLILRGFW